MIYDIIYLNLNRVLPPGQPGPRRRASRGPGPGRLELEPGLRDPVSGGLEASGPADSLTGTVETSERLCQSESRCPAARVSPGPSRSAV